MPTLCAHAADSPGALHVRRMLEVVPERGSEIQLARAGSFVLGLAADARLPNDGSICERDDWACVLVGTLDNAVELSASATPAEKVLEIVRFGGADALNRLRGAFAVVVTDGRRVWAARDHVGGETLYWHEAPGRLLVVSEPKQLQAVPGVELEPDHEVVEAIFYGEDYEPRRSVYRNVQRVGAASCLEWSASGSTVRRYWHPEELFETARVRGDEIGERFHDIMSRAVRRTLRGDDAVLLSGGIDSPAIAAYAGSSERGSGERRIGAISGVFPQHPSVDESSLIRTLAAEYGLDLHTFSPEPLRLDRLAEWVRTFDGPWSAWHPGSTEATYRFATERGYSVLLTGFFAELVADLSRGLVPYLVARGRIASALRYLGDRKHRGASTATSLRLLLSTLAPHWAMSRRRRRRPVGIIPPWMDAKRIAERDAAQALAPRHEWKVAQLGFLNGQQPSMEGYAKLQARWGVRVRHPWSDVDLWEFFLSLPAEIKHPDSRSKALLRNVLRGRVPDVILDRRKMVFNAYITDRIDYPSLRQWLQDPPVRLAGIDYGKLAERLAAENMEMSEFMSAKDLATAHAFLAQSCQHAPFSMT